MSARTSKTTAQFAIVIRKGRKVVERKSSTSAATAHRTARELTITNPATVIDVLQGTAMLKRFTVAKDSSYTIESATV